MRTACQADRAAKTLANHLFSIATGQARDPQCGTKRSGR